MQKQDSTSQKSARREFLKTTTTASVALAVGGLALSGCKNHTKQEGVISGKSPKEEVLYTGDTTYWKTYYSVAK